MPKSVEDAFLAGEHATEKKKITRGGSGRSVYAKGYDADYKSTSFSCTAYHSFGPGSVALEFLADLNAYNDDRISGTVTCPSLDIEKREFNVKRHPSYFYLGFDSPPEDQIRYECGNKFFVRFNLPPKLLTATKTPGAKPTRPVLNNYDGKSFRLKNQGQVAAFKVSNGQAVGTVGSEDTPKEKHHSFTSRVLSLETITVWNGHKAIRFKFPDPPRQADQPMVKVSSPFCPDCPSHWKCRVGCKR